MIQNQKLLIVVGTGGVGKTSVSMSLAIAAAQEGKKVAALTIDPSKRLTHILKFSENANEGLGKKSSNISKNLDIFHIDTEVSFLKFVASHVSEKYFSTLKTNKIFNQISKNLRETHHFSSLYEMVRLFDSNQYDLIVLDTPPSNQVIDFFESPRRLNRFFFLKTSENKKEWMNWVKERSIKVVETLLSKIVGNELVKEIDLFFEAIVQIRLQVQQVSSRFVDIMNSESTKTILVYSGAKDKIVEAQFLQNEMHRNNMFVDTFVMNRAYVPALDQSKGDLIEKDSREEELYDYFSQQKEKSLEILKRMKKQSAGGQQTYVIIPEIKMGLNSLQDVLNFSQLMKENWTEVK